MLNWSVQKDENGRVVFRYKRRGEQILVRTTGKTVVLKGNVRDIQSKLSRRQ